MFSQQTELEITLNAYAAAYGASVVLSAHAYIELLDAAQKYKAMQAGVVGSHYVPTVPIKVNHA